MIRPARSRERIVRYVNVAEEGRGRSRRLPLCLALRAKVPWAMALTWVVGCCGVAAAAPPTLSHIFPAGGQRGTKVTVTCSGTLDPWPVSVWVPGVQAVALAETGKLEISIPPDLAADRVWLRLYNAEGASAAVPLLVGNLQELLETEPNNEPTNAQLLSESSLVVNGRLEGADVDGFAVDLAAGQTLVADLDAFNALASPMDAILQIAAPDGTVLAENHDDVDLDPRLAYTARMAGRHIVRLFAFPSAPDTTISYRGGPDYIYRLTLTTGPYITHALPLAAPLAAAGTIEVVGWNISAGTRLSVAPFRPAGANEDLECESLADLRSTADARLGLVFGPGLAGSARIRLTPYPVVATLAASEPAEPTLLVPPSTATGWMLAPRQVDRFRVPLQKGQQVVFSAQARSIESPLQPALRLVDPTGSQAAAVEDPAPTRATLLTHTAAHDGNYLLTIRDQFRQSGERCLYRLTARLEEADFELTTAVDALVVSPDKPTELVVNVVRRAGPAGTVGPITISTEELTPGVVAAPVVSDPSGDSAAKVTLSFTTTGPAFSGPIRIAGVATVPQERKRLARTPAKLGACFETLWLTAVAKP